MGSEGVGEAFLNRQYCDRQFVTFNSRKVDPPARGGPPARRWKESIDERLDTLLPFSGRARWAAVAGLAVAGGLVGLAGGALVTYLIRQARKEGLAVTEIGRHEAAQLRFPPGHPRPRLVYVGHPVVADRYLTLSDFHRRAFEHKAGELIGLLACLGAIRYGVEHLQGFATDLATNAALEGLSKRVAGATVGAAATRHRLEDVRSEWQLPPPRVAPHVPEGLSWYHHEDLWQRIATQRIRHHLHRFELDLRYEDDFGVNADVAGRFLRAGFDLGGDFQKYEATAWRVSGEFMPSADQGLLAR
jgi:hypothetical protein